MPRRCAFGCPSKGTTLHRFPDAVKFPERLKTWVNLVGGKLESASDIQFYKKKMVCDRHFTDVDRVRHNRLNALAIPSLYLHGVSMDERSEDDTNNQMMVASTSTLSRSSTDPVILQPSISGQIAVTPVEQTSVVAVSYQTEQTPVSQIAKGQIAVTPVEQTSVVAVSYQTEQTPVSQIAKDDQHFVSQEHVTLEHNYSVISKTKAIADKDSSRLKIFTDKTTRPLRAKIQRMRTEISRLRKRGLTFKDRLKNAEKVFNTSSFQHLIQDMTSPAQLFVKMQLQTSKKPKGRRFTLEEKFLSLSLYKKSPKCYRVLHKYFTLPSVKAMKCLLSKIKLSQGINHIIFKKIKDTVRDKPVSERLFSLIFDEMSLTPQVSYDSVKDVFEGFSTNKEDCFADHVMVFMIKSVKNNYKQPIAYYFTNRLTKIDLKKYIKEVITSCQNADLKIINLVCDQSSVNVSAINELKEESKRLFLRNGREWRHDIIRVNKENIISLYDTPHLIKGIRNNLITKDLSYTINGVENTVKWEYYQLLYAADLRNEEQELRSAPKLTEEHVNPEKINKMRVKLATQLFSHSVAVAAGHLTDRGDLPIECKQIIKLTVLLDNLFDSLNVSTFPPKDGKRYTGAVKKNSCHHKLWIEAKLFLQTVRFRELKKNANKIRMVEKVVPSVNNFIKTIEGMEAIWDLMSKKYGIDSLLTRNFNQDPIENFFGSIRSYGARNNAPNTVAFQGAFKALLLNNYSAPHSNKSNCEEDTNKCLQSLKFFLTEETEALDAPVEENEIIFNNEILANDTLEPDAGQRNYVCGWVLTKCLKNIVKGCKKCKQDLIGNNESNVQNDFIKAKEYTDKKWLCYPNKQTENCFHSLQNIIVSYLKNDQPKKNVKRNIISFAELLIEYPFHCQKHKMPLTIYFTDITVNVIVHSWCRSINRILCGKLIYNGDDKTKIAAQRYYDKHKHYKNKK